MRSMGLKLVVFITATGLGLNFAEGSFEGGFKYVGYNIQYQDGLFPSSGETKIISAEVGDITTTPSNTFTAAFSGGNLYRNISNEYASGEDTRCYNSYTAGVVYGSESIDGTISPASNSVLNISTSGEEGSMPLFFNTSTNVAIILNHTDDGNQYPDETGFGLLIKKGSGLTTASVAGNYLRFTLGNTFVGVTSNGWGNVESISLEQSTFTLDGLGGYTETGAAWSVYRAISDQESSYDAETVIDSFCTLFPPDEESLSTNGTYSVVESDGTLLITSEVGIITNQVSSDGNMAASILLVEQEGFIAGTYLTVAIKQPTNMPTNAIDAVYFIAQFDEQFEGYSDTAGINNNLVGLGRTYAFFNTDNTFSIRTDDWSVENRLENHRYDVNGGGDPDYVSANLFTTIADERSIELSSGTYTIATNGVVSLAFSNGDQVQGQLSENGEYVAFGFAYAVTGYYAERLMGFGIRRIPPAPPTSPVVFNNDITMTSTGLVMSASVPVNYPLEGLYTPDLTYGEWYSGGVFSNDTGTLFIQDEDAVTETSRFYSATFAPW